jgi:hemolysin activation/secretion protein
VTAMRRLCASGLAVGLAAGGAQAQSIERNLPPAPVAPPAVVAAPALPAERDDRPIGPPLSGIVVLVGDTPALSALKGGVDVSRAPRLERDEAALQRFLGRPISRKLIAEIEAEIAQRYRLFGYPFASVSTPEQEIGSGVLQVRVLEFRLGVKTAPGARPSDTIYIEGRVRASPGDAVYAPALTEDLDWLNRYPFRSVEAVFSPSQTAGATDLALRTTNAQPWQVYAGYANSGSPLTGTDRYFAGAQAAIPGLRDAVASYQFTGSNDAVFDGSRPFASSALPAYVSHAGRLVAPTLPRQEIEASLSYVLTDQAVQSFESRQTTLEASLLYRSALSNLLGGAAGDIFIGAEAKRQGRETLFGQSVVDRANIDVLQVVTGYTVQTSDRLGRLSGDVSVHISPGGLDRLNDNAAFLTFAQGRFSQARYAYVSGDVTRETILPALPGFVLVNSILGQYAMASLPTTEQIGLGGTDLVRAYTLDDGAFDAGIVSRNELRAPPLSLPGDTGGVTGQISPLAFADVGYGEAHAAKLRAVPVSVGIGAIYRLGRHLSASADGAWALRSVGLTRARQARVDGRLTFSY